MEAELGLVDPEWIDGWWREVIAAYVVGVRERVAAARDDPPSPATHDRLPPGLRLPTRADLAASPPPPPPPSPTTTVADPGERPAKPSLGLLPTLRRPVYPPPSQTGS